MLLRQAPHPIGLSAPMRRRQEGLREFVEHPGSSWNVQGNSSHLMAQPVYQGHTTKRGTCIAAFGEVNVGPEGLIAIVQHLAADAVGRVALERQPALMEGSPAALIPGMFPTAHVRNRRDRQALHAVVVPGWRGHLERQLRPLTAMHQALFNRRLGYPIPDAAGQNLPGILSAVSA
jgi:hypothetical protein